MTLLLSSKVPSLDDETFYMFLIYKLVDHFREDWEDPAYGCSSDVPRPQQPPREFLNDERLRMGSDHDQCKCAFYGCTSATLRSTVKFLQIVRDVYNGSDRASVVFDACFILLDKMLHGEIAHQELFDRLHCMFVNDFTLVHALLWLGAPNLIWTRPEVEKRIWECENYLKDLREQIREFIKEYIRGLQPV